MNVRDKKVPANTSEITQAAFQFVIDTPSVFTEELSQDIRSVLSENALNAAIVLVGVESIEPL